MATSLLLLQQGQYLISRSSQSQATLTFNWQLSVLLDSLWKIITTTSHLPL
jgi:hypothetical protein